MSEARERLVGAASALFYAEGLHSVGVDRILAEANVTRATMYRHFRSKDDLVVDYLTRIDEAVRGQVAQARASSDSPDDVVRSVAQGIAESIEVKGFRGCAFLNAVAEYPDPKHPVHRAVTRHRDWFAATVVELIAATGESAPEPAARHFVMLRDGAMAAGCLTDSQVVGETFLLGVEGLLTSLGSVRTRG